MQSECERWSDEQMLVKHAYVVPSVTVKLRAVSDTWKAVTFQLKITVSPLRELCFLRLSSL